LSYCSVFGQWYFGERVSTIGSFIMASTKSFGSVCFGSLIIAVVRTLRYMADQAKKDDNAAMVIMGYVLSCLLACIEDMIEWFSSFAYVQCAIRGCSFCDAARATMHLCTSANVNKIIMQMLSGSITFMGCLLSGVVGSVAALHVARGKGIELGYIGQDGSWPNDDQQQSEIFLFLIFGCSGGIMFGFFGSGNVMAVVEAGINTILVCWAERPGQLESTHPEVHARFMGSSERDLSVAPGISARQPALY
jgi:hypothetical protein